MTKKRRLSMRKIKEIIRLKASGLSNRQIANSCKASPSTISEVLCSAEKQNLTWPEVQPLDETELEHKLFPNRFQVKGSRPGLDLEYLHRELFRKDVTLQLLWEEYKRDNPDGYQYSYFCEIYQKWRGTLDVRMRQQHKAGEKTLVDFAGQTVPVQDPLTGEIWQAHIFVAVLAATDYTFAMATRDETLENWISGHIHAFEYFGGLTEILIPDNPRALVTRACRYEPELNRTYQEMAEHYGVAVIPARPRKARDKAKAEKAVQLVEYQILAKLRKRTFFSLEELNQAIYELLIELNNKPYQKINGTRYSLFEELEKPLLKPLPAHRYEFADWKVAKVNIDYHVEAEKNFYSVPYQLVKKEVMLRITASTVEIMRKGKRVTSHERLYGKGKHSTFSEHMPKSHQEHAQWTPFRILQWVAASGPKTTELAQAIMKSKSHPEQGFRTCLGLIRLGERYSKQRLEAACARALIFNSLSYRSVRSILEKGLDHLPDCESPPFEPIHHQNVRGPNYFN